MNTQELLETIKKETEEVKTLNELNDLKVKYMGKKGIISELNAKIKEIPNEEKKAF